MSLSHTFVLNLKLERLCLAKKILKDCGSSTKPRVSPMEFPSTRSALATIFHTRHSMTVNFQVNFDCNIICCDIMIYWFERTGKRMI